MNLLLLALGCTFGPQPPVDPVHLGMEAEVTSWNARISGLDPSACQDPVLEDYVERSVTQHVSAWKVFERLEAVTDDYEQVVLALRAAELPDAFAGVPYLESRYRSDALSRVCSVGYWQFMPEVAVRMGLRLEECRIEGVEEEWVPAGKTPGSFRSLPYVRDGSCAMQCAVDERMDLARSTAAAIALFGEAWTDPELRASGAIVQVAIAAHNGGHDDSRHGQVRRFNLRPAFLEWAASHPADVHPTFVGANIAAETPGDTSPGDSVLMPETQHYAYTVIAQHLVAACYYGLNHGSRQAFARYSEYHRPGGWCTAWDIPSREEVLARR